MVYLNKFIVTLGMMFVLVFAAFTYGAETIVISFEQKEGFPAAGGNFTGNGIPIDVVTAWTKDSTVENIWFIDDGPGGVKYPDAPVPVSGKQIAGFGEGGIGINIGTMHLDKKAKLGLTSFYWAYRGHGNSRPGGDAYLEVEYYDLNGKSVGKDKFQGGLNPDWTPKFELAKPTIQGGALSKIVFSGTPSDPAKGHGTFFLDDITLSVVTKDEFRPTDTTPSSELIRKYKQMDTTPPKLSGVTPSTNTTVGADSIISVKFADTESDINISSVKIFINYEDVTNKAKITAEEVAFQSKEPLKKGIHRVEVRVSDKAGNKSNPLIWRFGVAVPVTKELSTEEKERLLFLVKDGSAVSTIVIPRDIVKDTSQWVTQTAQWDPDFVSKIPKDANQWTFQSAIWLREYVRKASGAELKIVSEDEIPSGNIVSVGHTELAKKAGIDISDLKWDGCKLIVKGNVLYLLGRDSKKENKADPVVGARGTCRAVATFLEDYCGVRWFIPTTMGEIIPESKDIAVPKNLSKTAIPAFGFSDGRATYSPGFLVTGGDTIASIINNFRNAIAVRPGGHTYYRAVPSDKYFKEHPEYFALINGNRTAEGNHLCTTNPEVRKLLLKNATDALDDNYELVSLGQEDGYLRCECPECENLDDYRYSPKDGEWETFQFTKLKDTPCERLFLAHKWVIDEVKKSYPDRQVLLMAYAPTAFPSKKIKYFGDNVIAEMSNLEPEYIEAWRDKVAGMTGQAIWFNIQCPMGMDIHATPREVAEKIRYLHENGFLGLYQFAETNWGLQGPVFYELGKLMSDPYRDYKSLIEEYCQGIYGKASNTMLEFFDLLYAKHEEKLPVPIYDFAGRNTKLPRWMNFSELHIMKYTPEFLDQLEKLLQKAEKEADTERSKGWLKLTRDHFDFTKLLTYVLISYRKYQQSKTTENWLEVKKRVEDFDAYRMKIITYSKVYTDIWFPGHGHYCNWLTGDTRSELKVYYIPWEKNKPEVLKKGIKGKAIGYGGSYYHSFVKEPLTLDFSKEEP